MLMNKLGIVDNKITFLYKYSTINEKNEATGTNRTNDCDLSLFWCLSSSK